MDQFEHYNTALAIVQQHKTVAAKRAAIIAAGLPVIEREPWSGYYRLRNLLPVAIWRDEDGRLQILRDNEVVPVDQVWPTCAWSPVPYEWYDEFLGNEEEKRPGTRKWPDASLIAVEDDDEAEPQAGAPAEDAATKMEKKIDAAVEAAAKAFETITSEDQANQAAATRSDLTALAGQANKKREALNRPHIDAQRENNERWNPIINKGKNAAEAIRNKLSLFRQKQIAEAQAAAAAAAASQPQPDAAPEFLGEQIGGNHPPESIAEQPAPQEPTAPVAFKGATGRATRFKNVKTAVITDYDALYAHIKSFSDMKATMQKIAQRIVDDPTQQTPPGVEVHEKEEAA
jgi:hypothetical protein